MNLVLLMPQPVVGDVWFAFQNSNFVSGKLFVGILFLVSIYAWTVMVVKWLVLRRAKKAAKQFLNNFRKEQHPLALHLKHLPFPASPLLAVYEGACTAVGIELESRGNEMEELFVRGLERQLKLNPYQLTAIRNAAERAIADQALELEDRMGFLSTAASAAPLLGLLGTVWGVMDTFSSMAKAGAASIGEVAPGISGALITTAAALVVAIPSAVGYNFLASEIRTIAVQMDNFADELMSALQREFLKDQG
ncbi:MAG: MotA/TolQ/ExbB proton channel family protein [Kiritimatiellaeota bacterium]|nr:MotA/TolQ/ExbB proton channel family protein [Kiritimatiellota bacterium]